MLKQVVNKAIEKHGSVSVFVFSKQNGQWLLPLLKHKKLGKWVVPGGHIESWENPFETVHREVKEESGLEIDVISFVHRDNNLSISGQILPPEFIFEQIIPARRDEPEHIHIDHVYIALAKSSVLKPEEGESLTLAWFTESDLDNLDMFEATRLLAKRLFPLISTTSSQN